MVCEYYNKLTEYFFLIKSTVINIVAVAFPNILTLHLPEKHVKIFYR